MIFLRLIAALLFVITSGCSLNDSNDDSRRLKFALSDDVKSWDPATAYDQISLDLVPSVYETLYQYDYHSDSYKIVPLLAADLPTFSKDGLIVTIPIRQDIRYQDDACFESGRGRVVTAHDFVFAFKRLAHPKIQSQGWWIWDGKIKGLNAFREKLLQTPAAQRDSVFSETPIEGLRAKDNHTLEIKLTRPYPQLLPILTLTFTAPVAPEAIKKYGDESGLITDHPVGTGPFRLESWKRNQSIRLTRNPHFHPEFDSKSNEALPFLDELFVTIIKEEQPLWLSFMSKKIDWSRIPADTLPSVLSAPRTLGPELSKDGVKLAVNSGIVFYFLTFNQNDPLLRNKKLRQALSSAIKREEWIDAMTAGMGEKMTHFLPPGLPDRPTIPGKILYDFDLPRAKRLLREAGYPDGKGLPTLTLDLRSADSKARKVGEVFSRQLKQIGVNINVVLNTFPAFLEKIKKGQTQLGYGGWMLDYPDAENVLQLLYGPNGPPGPNEASYNHPELNRWIEQAIRLNPGKERAALISKIETHLQEEVPWAYGFYMTSFRAVHPWVGNARFNDLMLNKYKYFKRLKR